MWILKPTFLNRGRGIHVFNSLASLEKLMSDYTEGFEEKSLKKQEKKEDEGDDKNEGGDIPIRESQNNNKKLSQSQPNIALENAVKTEELQATMVQSKEGKSSSLSLQKLPSPER